MNIEKVKNLNIPKVPGCYQFRDKDGEIIYIGKAADLRSRVLSYWRSSANHSATKFSMLKRIKSIDLIEVDSEIEALLLEANLIKKHQPQYNISMRDDKRHVYIKVSTEELYPRIFLTRKLDKSGRFFGPFVSVEAVQETLKIVRKIWPYRSCKNMPRKACLYFRIGKCLGPCEKRVSPEDYAKVVKNIILFLEGNKKQVVREIERNIESLEKKIKKEGETEELNSEIKFYKYQILNLKKVLGTSNILGLVDKYATDVVELAKVLELPKVPKRIEGYDISNIYGQAAVGSMVVFTDGEAEKSEYKKFKIKVEDSLGDTGMLREVLDRRFAHDDWPMPDLIIIDGGKGQLNVVLKILNKYDLDILAISVSKGEGLRSAQAPDKVFFPGEKTPLMLPLASPALHIIKRVRDEAHRFAITFHKQIRKKNMFKSSQLKVIKDK